MVDKRGGGVKKLPYMRYIIISVMQNIFESQPKASYKLTSFWVSLSMCILSGKLQTEMFWLVFHVRKNEEGGVVSLSRINHNSMVQHVHHFVGRLSNIVKYSLHKCIILASPRLSAHMIFNKWPGNLAFCLIFDIPAKIVILEPL